jgi:hypothetical protein
MAVEPTSAFAQPPARQQLDAPRYRSHGRNGEGPESMRVEADIETESVRMEMSDGRTVEAEETEISIEESYASPEAVSGEAVPNESVPAEAVSDETVPAEAEEDRQAQEPAKRPSRRERRRARKGGGKSLGERLRGLVAIAPETHS